MTFFDALTKWNGGILRGAQTRFAKALGVKQNTVSRWVSGDLRPGEEIQQRIAKVLAIPAASLPAMFPQPSGGDALGLAEKVAELERRVAALEGRQGSATGPEAWSGAAVHEDLIGQGAPPARETPPKTKGRSARR